ncbi:MAG: response regulator [Anaerohalosphaeraceae bacterium]|nr:response regulator [Anaerohalosphaeraceae bacterium]
MAQVFKVLIVDDEAGMCSGIKRSLSEFRLHIEEVGQEIAFEINEAGTAELGLEKIRADQPDILLLDHKLPGMSGLDLLGTLSEAKIDILTIMITAYSSIETAIEATRKGAYDFLAKPFTPAELKHMIRKSAGRIVYKRQAQKLAEDKRKIRFEFISILAHELKSPLAAVEGYLNIVKDKVLGDDLKAYETPITRSLIRLEGMRKLIFDLLDMTRIESQQKKMELTQVDFSEVVKKCVETSHLTAKERGIKFVIEVEQGLVISADAGDIEIILNNLISNAVKYNRDNGQVDIKISSNGDRAVISVSDTGIGMTKDECQKLFKDFVRIKNAKTNNILGSGLGLSVIKKLAQLYNGKVDVFSEPDVGTTFTVELPLVQPEKEKKSG